MSLALLKIASVFLIWLSALKIFLENPHYVSHPNHKKSFHRIAKQMNLYRSMEHIFYHLVLVVGGWLVKMLKIIEKLNGSASYHMLTM